MKIIKNNFKKSKSYDRAKQKNGRQLIHFIYAFGFIFLIE